MGSAIMKFMICHLTGSKTNHLAMTNTQHSQWSKNTRLTSPNQLYIYKGQIENNAIDVTTNLQAAARPSIL